ncbi:MAG: glycosyltransferase family 2 protein, partial [Bacteroidia bacterium]|nr:glycosyltransferase family 2 protein [Bacteroidia bacterium]
DADEFLSDELISEIKGLKNNVQADAYYLNRMSSINQVWIKHGSWFPHRIIRLFNRNAIQCGGNPPHDKILVKTGKKTARLKGLLMHHCNEDIHDRMVTINKHSTIAAMHRNKLGKKSNYFRILVKPVWKFIVEYFLRLGFLDGFYGLVLAKTHAYYIYLRESKLLEYSRKNPPNNNT